MFENKNSINNNKTSVDFDKYPLLNDQNIEKYQALTEQKPEVLTEIINSFFKESSYLISEMEDNINNDHLEKFQKNVHAIKGLFATIGATKLFEISNYMDKNNKQENFEIARRFLPILKSQYYELEEVLKNKFL